MDPVHPETLYAVLDARRRTPWSFTSGADATDGKDLGGIFKTTDGGATWDSACSGLPTNASIEAIAVNPGNPGIVLAAASNGVYRSTDAGASWGSVGGIAIGFDLALSPANPALAYGCLGYATEPCLYVSTDTGATWTLQPRSVQQSKGSSLIIDPSDADIVYSPGAMGVTKTTDRGENWAPANTGIRIATIPTMAAPALTLAACRIGSRSSSDIHGSWRASGIPGPVLF